MMEQVVRIFQSQAARRRAWGQFCRVQLGSKSSIKGGVQVHAQHFAKPAISTEHQHNFVLVQEPHLHHLTNIDHDTEIVFATSKETHMKHGDDRSKASQLESLLGTMYGIVPWYYCPEARFKINSLESVTIFHFKAKITTLKNCTKWDQLIEALASHLIDRYGLTAILQWYFEERTKLWLLSVNTNLHVGGTATCQSGWITETDEDPLHHANTPVLQLFHQAHPWGVAWDT
ncbi:hypothetical protein Pelo_12985 [Pelomyxa schiedti]|nr:hypothetical protein Pelo_12985 [Pelomyxa schiedti]